jgi:hypothetical protein
MAKVKARVTGERKLYLHNTLENSARFLKQTIERKLAEGNRDGIMFDYMNLGILLAFDFEAKVNFMGAKYVKPWEEKQRWKCKANRVFKQLGVARDWGKRPYSSIERMKKFRDTIAHGKPFEVPIDKEVTGEEEEIRKEVVNLAHAWEKIATHDEIMQAYEDTEKVWREMIEKSGIDIHDTLDQGEWAMEVLQRLD